MTINATCTKVHASKVNAPVACTTYAAYEKHVRTSSYHRYNIYTTYKTHVLTQHIDTEGTRDDNQCKMYGSKRIQALLIQALLLLLLVRLLLLLLFLVLLLR